MRWTVPIPPRPISPWSTKRSLLVAGRADTTGVSWETPALCFVLARVAARVARVESLAPGAAWVCGSNETSVGSAFAVGGRLAVMGGAFMVPNNLDRGHTRAARADPP